MFDLNVLFANDDVLTQWIMSEVLAEVGFGVTSACRADQVMELLRDDPDYDVLLADVALTDAGERFDIGQQWHAALPGRPVILTGLDRSALRRPLRVNESFLATPFSAATLLRTIDRALEEARFRPLVHAQGRDRCQFN